MSLLKEFREFAIKGNAIDMAVGIVIGAAFGKIVSSLVDNVIMPPLGVLIGGVDFSDLKLVLRAAEGEAAAVTLNYGLFIQTLVDFTIIAFAIFMMLKVINQLKTVSTAPAQGNDAPAAPPADIQLLMEIRDLLKKQHAPAAIPAPKPTAAQTVSKPAAPAAVKKPVAKKPVSKAKPKK